MRSPPAARQTAPEFAAADSRCGSAARSFTSAATSSRSEEHTSELQSRQYLHSFPTRRSSDLDEVAPGGTADSAGIRGGRQPVRIGGSIFYIGGDIITAIDGQPIRSGDDIDRLINAKNIGDHVQIEIVRSGSRTKLDAVLKEMPAGARRRA